MLFMHALGRQRSTDLVYQLYSTIRLFQTRSTHRRSPRRSHWGHFILCHSVGCHSYHAILDSGQGWNATALWGEHAVGMPFSCIISIRVPLRSTLQMKYSYKMRSFVTHCPKFRWQWGSKHGLMLTHIGLSRDSVEASSSDSGPRPHID